MDTSDERRNVSMNALRPNTRALICDLLNPQMFISSPSGTLRYWKGLAGLCQIGPNYEASLDEDTNPTNKVLNLWYKKDPQQCTVEKFLLFLEDMDRFDVIADVIELIDEDIRLYKENPREVEMGLKSLEADKYIITTDDVKRINEGLALENYDAFLLYDQDDIDFAIEMLETMEKQYNMKFCVKDRDLVGGGLEMDKMIRLITERCNRLIVILSDSFFKSSANDYYLSFAHAYGIESQRKIIPCVYKDLTTNPPHMKFLFTLDYRRMAIFNFWDKLRDTIRVGDPEKLKVSSHESETLLKRRRIEEYEDAKRPSTSSNLRVMQRHFHDESKSENGQTIRSVLQENNNAFRLKPINHGVKFSSSVGDLKSLENQTHTNESLNPSTSADNLGSYPEDNKKEKKPKWYKRITNHLKKDKTSDCKTEKEKSKGFKKHLKRVATVAN